MLLLLLLAAFVLHGFRLYGRRRLGERMRRLLRGLLGLPGRAQFGERLRMTPLRLRRPRRFRFWIALCFPYSRLHMRLIGSAGFAIERTQAIVIPRLSLRRRLIRHCYWFSG